MDGNNYRRGGQRGGGSSGDGSRGRGTRGRGRGYVNPAPNRGGPAGGAFRGQQRPTVSNQPTRPMSRPMEMLSCHVPRAPNPEILGRGTTQPEPIDPTPPPAPTEAAIVEGRGGHRGKRVITEIVASRPTTCVTKCGFSGTKVNLQTNYFRVLRKPEWTLYQYHVDFSPNIDLIRARRYYLAQHKAILGGYIFDGNILFCVQNLPQEKLELMTKNREEETILMKIKLVGIVDSTNAQQLQVLNLILRRAMEGLKLQLVGRNFFDVFAKIDVDQFKMEIWPGYTTSIRQHEQDILLCCEIAHKVMRTDSLYHILRKSLQENANYQDSFKRLVIGSIVLTDYNNKTYRIDDVDFNSTPLSTFPTKDGGSMSFSEYYLKRYNLQIRDLKQPMLVSLPKEKDIRGGKREIIMLVPELSRATGMTDEMRSNMRLMKAMSEHTRLAPERRIDRLRKFNQRLQNCQESVGLLYSWNMKLDKNLVEIPGRTLSPEKIYLGNKRPYQTDSRADWSREFRQNRMFKQTDILNWCVITPKRNIREVQNFIQMCIRAARGMGMEMAHPNYEEMRDDRNSSYSQAIENIRNRDYQIIMIVLVRRNEEKYSCIKKKCCVDIPIPSQVCILNTIAPQGDRAAGLMSVATKIVIQLNAKLGGQPWLIEMPLKGLMTVGFDVCHSAKDKNKSFGALVATMDIRESGRYYSHVMEHEKNHELSNQISMCMTYALKTYQAEHGKLPERIIFYRDGVGDGQLHQVFQTEVNSIVEKLNAFYKSCGIPTGCRFAFIVVSKRINTRYFSNQRNPDPGTVVDDIITLPERYDFFLVSQSVRQGTVSPTSYNVIYDTTGLTADRLQILTYKMTHMYYNWSGTCRVPAVCQYAHKLAFLVAESIHRCPSNALEGQLYFL